MDATLNSLALFNDPSRWVVKTGVPIWREHIATGNDGKPLAIDRAELDKYAAELQRMEQVEGVMPRLTLGHTLTKDPRTGAEPKETDQPPLVGFARNARVSVYGPKNIPGVLADFWYKREDFERSKEFPHRSPEVYLNARQITGVALLKRDPKLDMGMTIYQIENAPPISLTQPKAYYQRTDGLQFYALDEDMEQPMANYVEEASPPAAPPSKPATEPAGTAPAGTAPGGPDDGGLEEIQGMLAQMSPEEFQQWIQHLTELHAQSQGGGAGSPPATPAAAPPMTPNAAPCPPTHMQRDTVDLSQYARENAELRAQVQKHQEYIGNLEFERIVATREKQLHDFDKQGYTVVEKDFDKAKRYSREQWDDLCEDEIKNNRQRNHGNDSLIAIASDGTDVDLPSEEERAERRVSYQREQKVQADTNRFDKVVNYMREQGVAYDVAEKAIDKHGKVKKTA